MLSVRTPAKINLFLNIRTPGADGYHEICSVMQAIQLWDRLDVEPYLQDERLKFSCNIPAFEAEAENNLVVKAYHLFWQTTGMPRLGLKVHLEKQIPWQAGLGGGSSDAAAMLSVLNHLAHAGLNRQELAEMGARLGSDVPFFFTGGTALATGRGERIEPVVMDYPVALPLAVIHPKAIRVSTAKAYEEFRRQGDYREVAPEHLLRVLGQPRLKPEDLDSYLHNDFERVLFPQMPELWEIANRMKETGIARPLLCGSGSALAGFMEASPRNRALLQSRFPASDFSVFWCRTHSGTFEQVPAMAHMG